MTNDKRQMTNDKSNEEILSVPLDLNELRQLLLTLAQTDITELTLKSDDFELTVRKAAVGRELLPTAELGASSTAVLGLHSSSAASGGNSGTDSVTRQIVDRTVTTSVPLPTSALQSLEPKFLEISSPMVGTFYRSPAPGEPPFVEMGDRVRVGQTVCIIEAMKLMNEIEAEVSGQIIEILVKDGEPVEYGQPLMRINPN